MPKVTNLGRNPVTIYCGGVSMAASHDEPIESPNFTETELKYYRAHPELYSVEGEASEQSGVDADEFRHLAQFKAGVGPIAERLHIGDSAIFTQTVIDALDAGDKAKAALVEIVALFGTDEVDELNLKSAVERLIQDARAKPATDTSNAGASDLASAIALLDDANDEHWTQAGLPDISTLKTLTGGDVTRAMVDQLPADQKRERVKPAV